MIDIHSHILPGIDDGAADIEESLAMAKIYVDAGFRHVMATPHVIPGAKGMPAPKEIRDRTHFLNRRLNEEDMRLTVIPGMEVALDTKLPKMIDRGSLLPLGDSKYILVETPFQQLPLGWHQILFELHLQGFQVLLAHPERCAHLMKKPALFDKLIHSGVYLQVNWGSFLGYHGPDAKSLALHLTRKYYIHCLATDSHDARHRHAGCVAAGMKIVALQAGEKNLDLICRQNPQRILSGEPLKPMAPYEPPASAKRKWRWYF